MDLIKKDKHFFLDVLAALQNEIFEHYDLEKDYEGLYRWLKMAKNSVNQLLKNPFYYGEMYVKKYNKYFPHKYEPLISKALFDECQRVTQMRAQATNRPQALKLKKNLFLKGS